MKLSIVLAVIFSLISCSTHLSQNGKKIIIVTDGEKEKYCKMLEIITTSNDFGWSSKHDTENAMNEARNTTAKIGGNAIRIISVNFSQGESIIQAEALICNFPEK